ncbi:MAG: fatty acid desaturase [Verrucomicrobiales bacterium]|nr:fatty acid desaturase [Verrucomicrobiales bacterium]
MAVPDSVQLRNQIAELRRRRRWLPSIAALGSTFCFIAVAIASLRLYPGLPSGLFAFVVVGLMQYRLVLASHEATHKTLLPPVWLNEAVGLACASLVGVSLFNYRRAHLEHHKSPQSIQDDIDGYIYRPLISARPGWPRFLLLFTGNYVDIAVKIRRKFRGDGDLEGHHALVGTERPGPGALLLQLVPLAAAQLAMLAVFWWAAGPWAYPVFWLAPIFAIALQLDRIRTFLEHGYNYFFPGPPVGDLTRAPQSTIDVQTNFVERYLFAPFGFADHQAHHAQLTVPFYNLPELRRLLENADPSYVRRVRASYFSILARMIHAPVAPEFEGRV